MSDLRNKKPVLYLEGKELNDGWKVTKFIPKSSKSTGGNFSESYIVEKQDQKAFMKALDFSNALRSPDFVNELNKLTREYLFEEELYEICKEKRMSKVVKILGKGTILPEKEGIIPVPYLIFELAAGDIRHQIDFSKKLDIVWYLKILHNVATGLKQMHYNGMAHQDIKPSNILVFGKELHKISDLGRSDSKDLDSPFKDLLIVGDPGYAPPEGLYGHIESEWIYRRQACDVYLLGSLMVFLFTQLNMTTLLFKHLNPIYVYYSWYGTYEDVLPYLQDAFDNAVSEFMSYIEYDDLSQDLGFILKCLSNPNPKERGHPKNISQVGSSLTLDRFVTMFARLYKNYEIKLLK